MSTFIRANSDDSIATTLPLHGGCRKMNYYNEFDPKAAAWLRELIKRGLIPDGIVDTRSITEVKPDELRPYTQCHFFAGIGGWSLALELAGWPATRPVWTGSCPCQPFSCAGAQRGTADERHLWPVFRELIRACQPPTVFGEQVASALGRGWLSGVRSDLEGMGYGVGAADLCAASVGAPHIRQRLYWGADSESRGFRIDRRASRQAGHFDERSEACRLADADTSGRRADSSNGNDIHRQDARRAQGDIQLGADCKARGLGDPVDARLEGHAGHVDHGDQPGRLDAHEAGSTPSTGCDSWSDFELIHCADGKSRRIEPGLAPLAHGISARVVRLRGYGNAIVPPLAAQFIKAAEEAIAATTHRNKLAA